MEKRISVAQMPNGLEKVLKDKNLLTDEVLVFAAADMDANCNVIKNVLILTKSKLIHGFEATPTTERLFSGFKELPVNYKNFIFNCYV